MCETFQTKPLTNKKFYKLHIRMFYLKILFLMIVIYTKGCKSFDDLRGPNFLRQEGDCLVRPDDFKPETLSSSETFDLLNDNMKG